MLFKRKLLIELPIYLNLLNYTKAIGKKKKKDNELMLEKFYTHTAYDIHKQYWAKETRHKKLHFAWFHLYTVQEQAKTDLLLEIRIAVSLERKKR